MHFLQPQFYETRNLQEKNSKKHKLLEAKKYATDPKIPIWIIEEIKEEIKRYLETKDIEDKITQTYGTQ